MVFMMSMEIYYFSGTGNSLHVARELQTRVPGTKLIPMVSLLNQDVIATHGETVGFVFPIYFTAVPMVVKNFIQKLDLQSTKFIFAIATRIGTSHSAFFSIDKILKQKGKSLDAYFTLNMASNDPKFNYQVPNPEEIAKLESVVQERLGPIGKIIISQAKNREEDIHCITRVPLVRLLARLVALTDGLKTNLYADGKCTGCGTCEKVCLSKKIKMNNQKPVWQERVQCFHCAACLNYCPAQAVQIKSFTEKNGRYPHPYATVEDIVGQKG
jgi:ferredoxin